MSAPVDVLAVMDRHIAYCEGFVPAAGSDLAGRVVVDESNPHVVAARVRLADAREARAAVAELVEANKALLAEAKQWNGKRDWRSFFAWDQLNAALARVQGS